MVVSALGVGLLALGVVARQRLTQSAWEGRRNAGLLAAIAGGTGALWVVASWLNFDNQFNDSMADAASDDPFSAMLMGSVGTDPGYGLMLSFLGLAAITAMGIYLYRLPPAASTPTSHF